MVEGLPIQHTIAYYNGGTVEVFKCPSCGKLLRSSDVELFKHIHRIATYIILGECPYCKHKFQPEPIQCEIQMSKQAFQYSRTIPVSQFGRMSIVLSKVETTIQR